VDRSPVEVQTAGISRRAGSRISSAKKIGWVYTSVLRQLVNRMYRERDYRTKRKRDGQHTAYDCAVDHDQKALAWAIRALVQHVPADEKARPEPPRTPSRRLSAEVRAKIKGRPSWNGQPKRDWAGPELPPRASGREPWRSPYPTDAS
jgi:hypothetical protein